MKKILISFSGGRTSAFMTIWLLRYYNAEIIYLFGSSGKPKYKYHQGVDPKTGEPVQLIVVFSNTGKERKETLKFINECDIHFKLGVIWIEPVTVKQWGVGMRSKVVIYGTANRDGSPFRDMIAKYGIPNRIRPFCSEYMKKNTIRHFGKSINWKGYFTAIGIRVDEIDRMSVHREKEKLMYPLCQMIPSKKADVISFWEQAPFDLQLKGYEGNCDLCWKKSVRKHLTLITENPEITKWWDDIEQEFGNYIPPESKINGYIKTPIQFFRNDRSTRDLIELSKESFTPAKDDSKELQMELFEPGEAGLFSLKNPELDDINGCEESCEAF